MSASTTADPAEPVNPVRHASLPHACSLCGSCGDVCPVKIPLPRELLAWRAELVDRARTHRTRRLMLGLARRALERPRLYAGLARVARTLLARLPRALLYARVNAWGRGRELPDLPRQSFRELYAKRRR